MRIRKIIQRIWAVVLAVVMLVGMAPFAFAVDSTGAQFQNGPYLLAPKTTSMVVAWESTEAVSSTIAYGTDENALSEPVKVEVNADAPDFQGKKMNLFHYKLENLQPNTRYYYEVALAGGATCKASFKTLSENPEDIRIISLSDSHIFATRPELSKEVKKYDPDLMLHCGDTVEGTGAQAEQFSFLLKGIADDDFIHYYPVVYASGNHDQGGVYFNSYIYDIQDEEYGAQVEGDSSFNYGNLHIITMNSNPWGLFQLNLEAGGGTADPATLKTIDDAMAWLKADLESEQAKNAEFRIIMMHHPVSDDYTKRYIPDVIEPGGVDLLLSGHTHSYARAVSSNPAVGAGTIYLTHQDARTYNKKGDFFYISCKPGEGLLTVENYGADGEGQEAQLANTTLVAKEKQVLAYSDISITPNEILCNDDITVSATVKNNGKGLAAAVIPVEDNGEIRYLYEFDGGIKTLEPGESASLSGTLRMNTLGTHTVKIADKTASVEVKYREATFDYTNIRTKLGEKEVSDLESNVLHIKADVNNIGNDAGNITAEFKVNGQTQSSQPLSLGAGETKTVEFAYQFDKAGEYQVTIGNAEPQTIYIEGSIQGIPIVKDKSGNNNNGYIHGQPEFGIDDNGKQVLILDGKRDYIEIPDNGSYLPENAMTGMVWAKLPGAGTTKGGVSELIEPYVDLDGKGAIPDHNPLMMKGISIGWGTPYMFRIAVRETGKVTYGVCLLDDNGEFQWNDDSDDAAGIKKDTWVQYTSAFDFTTGGDSYQNELHSAHVDKPAFDAPIQKWEGYPMYIGLGFKNTLLARRNRGMYHTMLPGEIGQVRFYTSKLTEEQVQAVRKAPDAAGAASDSLKIWLDFSSENIETKGSHTTEWAEVTGAPTSLAYDVAFAGKASVTAVVQTSNDGKAVAKEKTIELANGKNTADISDLGQAKYVRIQTNFVSDLNNTESSVPVLNEYVLTAGGSKTWNTVSDWNKGAFTGAAGHQLGDVYRNHAKDFDDFGEITVTTPTTGTTPTTPTTPDKPSDSNAVNRFTDMTNHWAKDAVNFVAEKKLFNGVSASVFAPDNGMTRGMFVTVLGRLDNVKTADYTAASKFTDVAGSAYYAPYVNWATDKNIISGVSGNAFQPNQLVTFEQAAVILDKYMTASEISIPQTLSENPIPQITDNTTAYAVDSINKMYQTGLLSGLALDDIQPQNTITRAQVAVMLENFCEASGK